MATHWVPHISSYVQSNPVRNTDTDGAIESFRINGVSVFSRSSNLTKKYTFFEQNTNEIKQLGDWYCLTKHLPKAFILFSLFGALHRWECRYDVN